VAVNDVARIVEQFPIAFTQEVFPFLGTPEKLVMLALVAPRDQPPWQAGQQAPGQHPQKEKRRTSAKEVFKKGRFADHRAEAGHAVDRHLSHKRGED